MWLCTQHGFFSIIQKKPGEFHIRGRLRTDKENLIKLCGTEWPIIETKSGDYRYRIVCGQTEVNEAMAKLATAIDYSTSNREFIQSRTRRTSRRLTRSSGAISTNSKNDAQTVRQDARRLA